jgi:transposase-like protein
MVQRRDPSLIRAVFAQETQEEGSKAWRHVADQLRQRFPKLAALMDEAEADVIAFMAFPRAHWPKLHSTNPLERFNKEVKRRAAPTSSESSPTKPQSPASSEPFCSNRTMSGNCSIAT